MCYYIHLKVNEEGKAVFAEKVIASITGGSMQIDGMYPFYTLTNGMCSCDFVQQEGKQINIDLAFFRKILLDKSIKNLLISWSWGEQKPPIEDKVKIELNEFALKNDHAELQLNTWYQLFDASKYIDAK